MAPVQTKTKKRSAPTQTGPATKKIILADNSGSRQPTEKVGKKRSRPVTAPLVDEDEEDEEDDEGGEDDLADEVPDEGDPQALKDPNGTYLLLFLIL